MLVSEFLTTIQRDASETQDDTGYNALCLSWLQEALTEFGNATNWKHFQRITIVTSIIGTRVYELPIDHLDIRAWLTSDNSQRLEYMPLERIKARYTNIFQSGSPRFFYFEDLVADTTTPIPFDEMVLRVGMWPVPSAIVAYSVFTQVAPDKLTTTQVLPVTSNIIPLLKHKMRYLMAMDDEDADAAGIHLQLYQNSLNDMKEREHTVIDHYRCLSDNDVPNYRGQLVRFDPSRFNNGW
jgi:hypothetical protein